MKTKMLTATAFSLLMAVGAATAQSASDGMSGTGAQTTPGAQQATPGAPSGAPQQIDPSVTNSTTKGQSTTGDSTAQPDCDPSNTLTGETTTQTQQQNADGTMAQRPAC